MQVLGLFERGVPLSVSDVRELLDASGSALAYTTVMTVLSRLHGKGLLARKKDGRRYVYVANRQTADEKTTIVERVHRALFKNAPIQPIAALLDQNALSTEELRALRKLVDQKLKASKE
jgi:predicted transcriptional regulator